MDFMTKNGLKKSRMKSGNSKFKLTVFPMVALFCTLSGCEGPSNNLPDPSANTSIVPCSATNTKTCVNDQFIVDAPVVGLSYQCGTINGVTDSTGTVSCPANSVVTFSIQGTGGLKSITLGKYLVRSVGDVSRKETASITPLDLIESSRNATSLLDGAATPAVNIAQLLQTLRSPTSPYTVGSPTSRLIINPATKDSINLLAANITATDFLTTLPTAQLAPVFTSLGVTVVSTADTISRFSQALRAIQAGSYYTNPLQIFGADASLPTATVATSSTTNDEAVIGFSNIIDRSGFALGLGAQWNGNVALGSPTQPTTNNLLTGANGYTRLMMNTNSPSFLNPVNQFFLGANFAWQPQSFSLDTNGVWQPGAAPVLGNPTFTNGRLIGGTYIVGSNALWQNVSNTTTLIAPLNELATWSQSRNSVPNYYTGKMTLQKLRSVDTFLDPAVYKTADNVGSGNRPIFPLYAVLTFNYTPVGSTTQTQLGTPQGIAILADGNIITDMNKQCFSVNPTTMQNIPTDMSIPVQQYRIGLVGAAFQGITNIAARYITPIISFNGTQFGALNGVQMGTLSPAPSSKINVQAALGLALGGSVNITDNTNSTNLTGEQSTALAKYVNYYDIWSSVKVPQTSLDAKVTARSLGTVTMALSPCYNNTAIL